LYKVRLLREAGGLGDVLCTLPVAKGWKLKRPDSEVTYVGIKAYKEIVDHCPYVDKWSETSIHRRRPQDGPFDSEKYPYLKETEDADVTYSLYCPAWTHEKIFRENRHKSRIQCFCEASDLDGVPLVVDCYKVTEAEKGWADGWLEGNWINPNGLLIGLEPYSTDPLRNWAPSKWRKLADLLQKAGLQILSFDHIPRRLRDFPGALAIRLSFPKVAALIKRCSLMITPDSGLLHFSSFLDVPTISLFGATNGWVTCHPYRKTHPVFPITEHREGCKPPCQLIPPREVDKKCRQEGCSILNSIEPEQVFLLAIQMLRAYT